ncbi:conjugal transfer protein [Natrialba sp. INN-245]|uniref:conjugal transfer protein n=1 Tax=Natrialba sp. INN-245 TaxID=2690967 RepID=UPI0013116C1B|nr:conjugal transfer protein [Natrialba sp. INN-245]MWV38819.1 conjugal transfer protein [Natrialba sp. INN-245]
MTEYIQVTPTSEEVELGEVPTALESLHTLTNPDAGSFANRLNPLSDTSPPTFEFLAISEGDDEPVEFYYGVDQAAHLETLEKRLRTIYPTTFDVMRSELSLEQTLMKPAEYPRAASQEDLGQGELQTPPSNEDAPERTDGGYPTIEKENANSKVESEKVNDNEKSHQIEFDEKEIQDRSAPPTDPSEETVFSRSSLEETEPIGVQWYGRAERKRDWMTTLKSFTNREPDPTEYDTDQPPLATLIDHLTEIESLIAFQVVWQRKPNWIDDAVIRQEDLKDGRDTFCQRYIGPLFEVGAVDPDDREQYPGIEARDRADRIEMKHPKRTFTVNARAVALATNESPGSNRDCVESRLDQLAQSLTPLDGPFYQLEGKRLRSKGVLKRRKRKRALSILEAVLDATLVTGRGKCRPDLVLNADELANLTIVPSSQDLTVEGTRGTRSEQRSRNPLPRPHPDLMEEFQSGMAIGYALDENGEPEDVPVRIPPSLLPTHYVRAATTGGGKSKSLTNDKLSLYDQTDGPIILIDAKGDGLCEDYMRAHARRFGVDDLEENVLHFPIPKVLPGFAFFNIERQLENGVRRIDAVQNKADHYEEILKMVMGKERYERAVVAPTLIKYLIKTLYDDEYGRENGRYRESEEYFAHDQLEYIVDQLWSAGPPEPEEGAAPRSSNPQVQRRIDRQLQLDPNTFATVMGGVSNRLDYISQDEHLRRVFNNTEPQFDFRDVLDDRKVILFDLSGLRDESAKAITGVILTELYNALKERGDDLQRKPDDYVVNLLIDEASSLAVSDVMNTLLEKGRSFRLSVGLSLQFPEQLDVKGGREVYLNVLNDVGSPIIGKIAVDNEIAKVMAHEDMDPVEFANRIRSLPRGEWIVRLPSPTFGETGPEPFSLSPLPIPPGHPESEYPLTAREEQEFQETLKRIHDRADTEYGTVTNVPPSSQTPATVRDEFDLPTDDLDVALATVIRSVQLQKGVREENGWVAAPGVDLKLRKRFEAVDADPPAITELGQIRERSHLIEVTLDSERNDIVVRLTDEGEAVAEPDTGHVRAAGGDEHDAILLDVERVLAEHGFRITVFTQDGSEKPDARATHPDSEHVFDIEVESTTPENPVKVLQNLKRAHDAGHIPLFVVAGSKEEHQDGLSTAARVERILSSPVNTLKSGEIRLYTTDSHLTFDGGAHKREGVTAVRPLTNGSRRTNWLQDDESYVLLDENEDELTRVTSFESLTRADVPAVYSYNQTSGEFVVYENAEKHRYETKTEFEREWTRIKRPFVPESDLPEVNFNGREYAVLVLGSTENDGNSLVIYDNGEITPFAEIHEWLSKPELETDLGLPEARPDSFEGSEQGGTNTIPKEAYNDPNAAISAFVDARLRTGEDDSLTPDEVYDAYVMWATNHEISVESKNWFARRLGDHIEFERETVYRDGKTVRCYVGLVLDQAEDQ